VVNIRKLYGTSRKRTTVPPNHVKFIKEVFPCTHIIVNLRSTEEDQTSSRNKSFHGGPQNTTELAADIEFQNEKLCYMATNLFGEDLAMFLDSSMWTKNMTVLNQTVKWLVGF
jgi:hypothetical protein